MKRFYWILPFFFLFFFSVPPYRELNHISIIDQIQVNCEDSITVVLREVQPIKEDNSIRYQYKYYRVSGNSLEEIASSFSKRSSFFYYSSIQSIRSNCISKDEVKRVFH